MCYPGKRTKLILQALERVEQNQLLIFKALNKMANEITNLAAAVAANTNVEASAVTLLNNLSILIKNAAGAGDLALVQQYADQINGSAAALAAAITANTPAAGGGTTVPTTTDKTYTSSDGTAIVISQAGDTPAAGDVVAFNGAPLTAGEVFTTAGGQVIVIGDDSKVISFTAAPATGTGDTTGTTTGPDATVKTGE